MSLGRRPSRQLPDRFEAHLYAALVLLLLSLGTLQLLASVRGSPTALPAKLRALPLELGGWRGREAGWTPEIVTALGVDDWMLREYQDASGQPLWLYIGFSERWSFAAGASPHSPLVCYPGQGWELIRTDLQQVEMGAGLSITVNRLLVAKGLERRLVLYWQQRGERIATEEPWGDYRAKLSWLLEIPSLLLHRERTDRALVRVSAPVLDTVDATLTREIDFVRAVYPPLAREFKLKIE